MAKSSWEDAGGRGEQHSPERQRQRKGKQEHASDRVVGRADDLVVADRRVAGWVGDALTAAMMKAESSRLSTTTMVAVNSVAQPEKRAWAPARWTIATANNAISRAPAVWSHAETRIALWKRVAKATSWAKVAVSNGMFGETKKCAVRATTPTTLLAELATLGVARISYGSLLHHDAMRHFTSVLTSLTGDPVAGRHRAGRSCTWTATEDRGTVPRMPHVLLNRLTARPGQRRRVVEILLESGKLFDDNPACLLYLVSEATGEPDVVWVVDLWTDQEAHAEALKAPELRPFVEQAMPLLEGMPEQIEVRPVGGKGLPR